MAKRMKPRAAGCRFTMTTLLLTITLFLSLNNFLEEDQGKNTTLSIRLHKRDIQKEAELEHSTIFPQPVLLALVADTLLKAT